MKCKRTGILRSEEIAVSLNPNSLNFSRTVWCDPNHVSQPGEEELHCLCPDSLRNEQKHNYTTNNHLKSLINPSFSGSGRVGRVHLFSEHRPRLFCRSPCSPRCRLLHLWHRKLTLVFFLDWIKSESWNNWSYVLNYELLKEACLGRKICSF